MKKVVIYCRVSTVMQEEKDSLKNQIEQCKQYCSANNMQIIKVFADVESGTVDDRNEYLKLKEEIEENNFDVLVVYETSRISRKLIELLNFLKLIQDKGIEFKSVTEQMFDTTTPEGKFAMSIRLSMIQFERDNTAKRVTERLKFKASQGQWVNGNPPYGYKLIDKKLVIVEEEAEFIRTIFNEFLLGTRITTLATKNNIAWGSKQIRRYLSNYTYAGFINYGRRPNDKSNKEAFLVKGNHEPIIDKETFEIAQKMLKGIEREYRKSIDISPFNGLLKCAECGLNYLVLHGDRYKINRYYACSSKRRRYTDKYAYKKNPIDCTNANIKGDLLEKAIIEELKNVVKNLDYINDIKYSKTDNLKKINKELEELKKQKEKLLDLYIDGTISKEKFNERNNKIINKISEIDKSLLNFDSVKKEKLNIERIMEFFNKIDFDNPKNSADILRLIIEKVLVKKVKYSKKDDFEIEIYLNIL